MEREISQVSQYQQIWNALKKDGTVKLTAPVVLHRRIVKAVIKRKYIDVGFKFLVGERGKKAKLSYSSVGSIIEFKLEYTLGVEDL